MPCPSNVPGVRTSLNAVTALSADDAWAGGSTGGETCGKRWLKTLTKV
jgi:hypothetical protein